MSIKKINKKIRIFAGLAEIAGNFSRLKSGFSELGHEFYLYSPREHLYGYPGVDPEPIELTQLFQQEYLRITAQCKHQQNNLDLKCLSHVIKMWKWKICNIANFICFACKFDVFIFHYGNSFHHKSHLVNFDDLFWLRLIRRKIIFLCCGSDSRPAWIDGAIAHSVPGYDPATLARITLDIARNNASIERKATHIISNIFSSYFFSREIVMLQVIGNAAYLPATPKSPKGRKSPIIVHAPSRTDAKGTSEILNILDELRAEGLMFTINVLVEKSNEDVLAALDECDFVIDQLYSDSPMATFASEAAAFGKPAIVGSYIKAAEFEWAYSMHGVPPSLVCHPNDLKAAIRSLITDIELRLSLGLKAQEYVKNFLAPEVVAKRYLLLFRRKAPRDWTCIPGKIYGCPPVGMTVSLASRLLRESMEFHDGSFFLPAKVAMRKSFEHLMRSDVFR